MLKYCDFTLYVGEFAMSLEYINEFLMYGCKNGSL